VSVFIALGIQLALRMRHIVNRSLSALQYSSTLSHKLHDFRQRSTEYKMFVLIFCTTSVSKMFHSKNNWGRYDQKPICDVPFIIITLNLGFPQQVFERCSNIKFNENPSNGSQLVPRGQTDKLTRRRQQPLFVILGKAPKIKIKLIS
jgi:hypothetical protein